MSLPRLRAGLETKLGRSTTLPELAASTQSYTKSVIQAFAANGTPVSQVAIGNEITEGMLWQFTQVAGEAPAGLRRKHRRRDD